MQPSFRKKNFYSYFKICDGAEHSPFLISEDIVDDDFAKFILLTCGCRTVDKLTKESLKSNRFGFTHIMYVPHQYHFELKGRLDAERANTTLCVPIFNSEFSGSEQPEEFIELRRYFVQTWRWDRNVSPKITLRFDNAKTKSGTGNGYVFAKFDQVLKEIENLAGVSDGFVEIINHKNEVIEILFNRDDVFSWINNRDDSKSQQIQARLIPDRLWNFLTS